MKTVGILTRIDKLNGKSIHYVPSAIIYKLKNKVKIKLIAFTLEDSFENIYDEIKNCNGIVLPGGDDVYPIELEVCKYLHQQNIPTLGICLGMQTMACAFNGNIGTLSTLDHKVPEGYVHDVVIDDKSFFYQIIKEEKIPVNSRHKDYVINTSLNIGAKSLDNVIEEVEDAKKTFFIGVQWHPENLQDKYTNRLFDYFISVL